MRPRPSSIAPRRSSSPGRGSRARWPRCARLSRRHRPSLPVRLVSDGLTDVSVLRVGRLGVFKEKTLQLRPGSYVVVGTRKGYRDTRVILEVAAGRPAEPVRVRCEETL